jgi:hypothetical protein
MGAFIASRRKSTHDGNAAAGLGAAIAAIAAELARI